MKKQHCPTCGQELPAGKTERELHAKLDQMRRDAVEKKLEAERKRIEAAATQKANAEAEKYMAQRVQAALAAEQRQNQQKQQQDQQKIAHLEKQLKLTEKNRATELEQIIAKAKKETQLKYAGENIRLQSKVNELSRQLEKKSNEELREDGERDLLVLLQEAAYPDRYERIGHGKRGADILETVMDGVKEAGCIVFENKNTLGWSSEFVTQAGKYRTQYGTPYVIIVSRVLPKKQRGMCVVDGIPVVEPHLAATLAAVMREGILEISKLRLAKVNRDQKAQNLLAYIVSDKCQTRFRAMSTAITGLKDLQQKERDWHENQWDKESKQISEVEKCKREIDVSIQSIIKVDRKAPILVTAYDPERLVAAD